ncbi:MAG: helix-turn-helix domain-containing protein [Romboutsia timonensis]
MIRLEEYRKANLYSIRQLSLKTGISRTYLTQLERGEKVPTLTIVCVLCRVFKCTPNDFIPEIYYK